VREPAIDVLARLKVNMKDAWVELITILTKEISGTDIIVDCMINVDTTIAQGR